MKKIYLDVAGRMHSLYKELILYPPSGYQFINLESSWDKMSSFASNINAVYSFQNRILGKIIPINFAKAYFERLKKPPNGTDLTYATGHLVFRKEPWVVDLEFVTQLSGYSIKHFKRYRKFIENVLASEYCKSIICWTEAGKKTILSNMDCQGFEHKVNVIRLATQKKNFYKDYGNEEKVKLLFVGSANIPGEFEYKGGNLVLEAFRILSKKYSNLDLVIRSDITQKIKAKYQDLDNLTIIEGIIPWDQLEQKFKLADIFLFPSHSTPGSVIIDAMSYELPVITTDVWANPEMVEDGKTGFIIKKSERVKYYAENFIPIWNYTPESQFMKTIENADPTLVKELVEKTSILIENKDLRRKMGRAGRQEIENGNFSIMNRNRKLKKIFDEAIGK